MVSKLKQEVFQRRERRELEVLRLLSEGSMRFTDLQKEFVKRTNETPSIFNDVFYILVASGRILKCGSDACAPFRLTDKGKRLLEALS